jgi:hypothetical protein
LKFLLHDEEGAKATSPAVLCPPEFARQSRHKAAPAHLRVDNLGEVVCFAKFVDKVAELGVGDLHRDAFSPVISERSCNRSSISWQVINSPVLLQISQRPDECLADGTERNVLFTELELLTNVRFDDRFRRLAKSPFELRPGNVQDQTAEGFRPKRFDYFDRARSGDREVGDILQ